LFERAAALCVTKRIAVSDCISESKEMTTKVLLIVIIGGGFGGLAAAKGLKRFAVNVLLIDRSNHRVFCRVRDS
jgi:hypothetical protein